MGAVGPRGVEAVASALEVTDHDAGVRYIPVIGHEGQVGYRCEWLATGEVTYIYLNASGGGDDAEHRANVFVHEGSTFEPWNDGALHFYDLEEPE